MVENVPVIGKPLDFQAFSDWVLIEEMKQNVSHGGIALPDNAERDMVRGVIRRAGPGWVTEFGHAMPMPVKAGDVVYLIPSPGTAYGKVQQNGKEYVITRARYLCGKTEDRAAASQSAVAEQAEPGNTSGPRLAVID